jgi:hypothetical protein
MAATDDDWRLTGQEDLVAGVVLVRRKYRQYAKNPAWDHDHCFFCNTEFSLQDGPGLLHEGYSTEEEYRWICTTCFEDFKDRFHWTVRAEETG